jgi:hypothetical protein
MTTYSGILFNFLNDGYIPPAISGSVYNFSSYDIHHLYTDSYIYAACSDKLRIYTIEKKLHAYVNITTTTVAGNDEDIYFGTASGIYVLKKSSISGVNTPYDLTDGITMFYQVDNIKYMHCKDNNLVSCTGSGVEYFKIGQNPEIHSTGTVQNSHKCFWDDGVFYTTSGIASVCMATGMCDWTVPDAEYSAEIFGGVTINDIYVSNNKIFCATSSGIYII